NRRTAQWCGQLLVPSPSEAHTFLNSDAVNRLLEEAADELARLDTLCRLTPDSVSRALWLAAAGTLAGSRSEGLRQLAVMAADPASAGAARPEVVDTDPDSATAGP